MGNLEWRRNAQPPSPLQPDENQHHKKSDSKWGNHSRPSVDNQPTTNPFHSQDKNEGGQETLVQAVDDLSLTDPRARNGTCFRWASSGRCTVLDCPWVHHLFPRVVYRAHRGGTKDAHCQYMSTSGECGLAEDMCGFSHEAITPEVKQKQKQMRDRIKEQKEDWVAKVTLKCRKCSFIKDGDDWHAADDMVDHCQKQHPPAAETASRNAPSTTTASSFMTMQPSSYSPTTIRHPAIFTGVKKEGDSSVGLLAPLDDNLKLLPGFEDGN